MSVRQSTSNHSTPLSFDAASGNVAVGSPSVATGGGASGGRVLMLTHRFPYPPDRGDRIRSFHLLVALSKYCDVSLACIADQPTPAEHVQAIRPYVKQWAIQRATPLGCRLAAGAALLTGRSATPSAFYRKPLAHTIVNWHALDPFDAVLTFCTGMIRYARHLTDPDRASPPIAPRPIQRSEHRPFHVLDLVDVDSLKWRAYASQSRGLKKYLYGLEARRLKKIEAGEFDSLDAITVISAAEARAYREHVGDHPRLTVAGNGVDLDYFRPLSDINNHTLAFVGVMNYPPNVEAACWFVRMVMPLVRKRFTDAALLIVGRDPSASVRALNNDPGVQVVGQVADVRESLQEAVVVVAPLQTARGVQNKVLEAMACQRAVIVSPEALAGLDATPGRDLLLAQTSDQWARQIERLFDDQTHRRALAEAGRRQVERSYAWRRRLEPMIALLTGPQTPALRAVG